MVGDLTQTMEEKTQPGRMNLDIENLFSCLQFFFVCVSAVQKTCCQFVLVHDTKAEFFPQVPHS